MLLIFFQIHQVAPQELLLLSAARGALHWEEQTVISQVAAVQRIHLRKALASEMYGSVLCLYMKCLSWWNDGIVSLKWYSITHTSTVKILIYKFLFLVLTTFPAHAADLFSTGGASWIRKYESGHVKIQILNHFLFGRLDFLGCDLSKLVVTKILEELATSIFRAQALPVFRVWVDLLWVSRLPWDASNYHLTHYHIPKTLIFLSSW